MIKLNISKELGKVIRNSKIIVTNGRFAMIKVRNHTAITDYFFISRDQDEVTAVLEEKQLDGVDYDDIQNWFKLIEISVAIPFFSVGFLASVTSTIANEGLNVLVISTFSKDYLLIREEHAETALKALRNLGFLIS